jgi:UDP:flavonoid glycosyltransferase YjiC (YdhE family)
MARILAYTSPAAGHLFPLVPGLLALQERGHDVHLRIGERLLGVARDAGLDARPSDPAGVPIAAVPFGRDQPEVARRLVEAGAGVQLRVKHLSPERLRATVREALAMRPSAEAAGARLRASGGGARFADAVEELANGDRTPSVAAA